MAVNQPSEHAYPKAAIMIKRLQGGGRSPLAQTLEEQFFAAGTDARGLETEQILRRKLAMTLSTGRQLRAGWRKRPLLKASERLPTRHSGSQTRL